MRCDSPVTHIPGSQDFLAMRTLGRRRSTVELCLHDETYTREPMWKIYKNEMTPGHQKPELENLSRLSL